MDPSKDLEVILNPKKEIWDRFVEEYRKINWGVYNEYYEYCLKNFGNEDFQYYAALDKETKNIVGSINICRYESIEGSIEIVCIGKYFVMPEYRGKKISEFLWNMALNNPKLAGKNLGLIGAQAMTAKYCKRSGFDKYYDYDLIVELRQFKDMNIENLEVDEKLKIVDFKDVDPMKVILFDTKLNGNQRRDNFLVGWLKMKSVKAAKVALNENNEVVGFIGLCEINNVLSPTPLFAMDIKIASTLLRKSLEAIENLGSYSTFKTISFEKNHFSNSLYDQLTKEKVVPTKLYGQFTQFVPKVQYDHIYCLTELGTNII